jgi:hypothetical protein
MISVEIKEEREKKEKKKKKTSTSNQSLVGHTCHLIVEETPRGFKLCCGR